MDNLHSDNSDRHFKGQQQNEIVICFTRKHWIVLLPHLLGFAILLIAITSFFLIVRKEHINNIMNEELYRLIAGIAVIGLTIYIHRFFLRTINFYLSMYIITNLRVIDLERTLYLRKNTDSIDIPQIQDIITSQKGIFKNILNYGEIIISLASVNSTKILVKVPNPEFHFRKIHKAKVEYIATHGLASTTAQIPKE